MLSKNTLILVTGDHGESLGENGIYFDHHGLYDSTLHVPLIMSGPSIPTGKRINGLVSSTDVFATILSMAKINYSQNNDSIDLTPYFKKKNDVIRDFVFAEENYYQENYYQGNFCEWKQHKRNIGRVLNGDPYFAASP